MDIKKGGVGIVLYLANLALFFLTAIGLWRTYASVPEIGHVSPYFFWFLLGFSIISIGKYKKSIKTMYPIATIILSLVWVFIQSSFDTVYAYAMKMAENPYAYYGSKGMINLAIYSPLVLGLFVFGSIMRALLLLQKTDPTFKEVDESTDVRMAVERLKKAISSIKKKTIDIKGAWQKTEEADFEKMNKERGGGELKASNHLLNRVISTANILQEKDFEEEFELVVCTDVNTGKKISLGYLDAFLHFLILGPTGSGKTYGLIKPMAWQIIKYIVKKKKIGLTVVEPKGDLAADIAGWCKKLNLPHVYVDPLNENSAKFNPLHGDAQIVAESTRTVLRKLFGRQEAFFAQVQETSARNTVLMLKINHGNNLGLDAVIDVLRDSDKLRQEVDLLKEQVGENNNLVQYFEKEILGKLQADYQKFAMGLRMQLEDLLGNEMLKNVITGRSDINFDKHLEEGGILVVNTAMGPLGKLGDAFGAFVIMHLQNAVFRRPGTEHTRTPHILIIDEAPRYLNPDFERLLTIGRSFRCACILAVQSLGQLQLEESRAFTNVVMTNCRGKVVFGGADEEDARKFEREFGAIDKKNIRASYNYETISPHVFPKAYQVTQSKEYRFNFTDIKEIGQYRFFYQLTTDGQVMPPGIGSGHPVDLEEVKQLSKLSEKKQECDSDLEAKPAKSSANFTQNVPANEKVNETEDITSLFSVSASDLRKSSDSINKFKNINKKNENKEVEEKTQKREKTGVEKNNTNNEKKDAGIQNKTQEDLNANKANKDNTNKDKERASEKTLKEESNVSIKKLDNQEEMAESYISPCSVSQVPTPDSLDQSIHNDIDQQDLSDLNDAGACDPNADIGMNNNIGDEDMWGLMNEKNI